MNLNRQAQLYAVSNIVMQKLEPERILTLTEVIHCLGLDKSSSADVEYAIEIIDATAEFIQSKWGIIQDDGY